MERRLFAVWLLGVPLVARKDHARRPFRRAKLGPSQMRKSKDASDTYM